MEENRAEKRAKFMEDYNTYRARRNKKVLAGVGVVLALGIAVFMYLNKPYTSEKGGNYNIGRTENYEGKKIEMKDTPMVLNNGKAYISLDTLKKEKILYTEYRGEKRKYFMKLDYLPLMAYVSPAGRVVLTTSICEPCTGTKFTIEGKELVCKACGTRWRLNDLMGLMGGCVRFAPEEIKYTVENNQLVIDEALLKNWQPRVYGDEMKSS
ncbi:MAG: Fe-S-containing protein [Bacillota bacterium]